MSREAPHSPGTTAGITILHCADLHLGAEGTSRPGKPRERLSELLGTFRRICTTCAEHKIDLLLIAGDLFEGSAIDPGVIRSVKEYLGDCPSRVFIAPGNHDYVSLESPYMDADWPANVHIFKGGLESVDLPDRPVTVWGAGFEGTYVTSSLLHFPEVDGERVNICVVHGDLVAEGAASSYHPVPQSAIAGSGMDYLALGHIHERSDILRAGRTRYAYPGCPDGHGFDELGQKGVYIGEVSKGRADLRFLPLASRMYLIEPVDVSGVETEKEAAGLIRDTLQTRYGKDWTRHYYRIRLTGRVSVDPLFWSNVRSLLLGEMHFVRLIDRTSPAVDLATLARETSLKGIFVRRMSEQIEQTSSVEDRQQLELALHYGLQAFEGEVIPSDD